MVTSDSPCHGCGARQATGMPTCSAGGGRVDWATGPEATLWHTGFTGTFLLVADALAIGVILLSSTTHNDRHVTELTGTRLLIHGEARGACR
jgi:CubicO group peptidase (beta-lactamase class C family)